jgi:uncharacterized membrane protein YdbT with pleckstrin-like domain
MQPQKLSPTGEKFRQMIEFDENEQLLMEVRKDPFGLFMIYFFGTLVTLVLFGVMVLGVSSLDFSSVTSGTGVDDGSFKSIIVILGFILTVFSLVITAIGAFLYRNNVVLITSEKIAQMLYVSLFNRKISQLSIADVQDVTVKQQGIFAHIFNYGTLTIETAGEQSNYTFTFTPEPYETAKALVGSHERDVEKHGN